MHLLPVDIKKLSEPELAERLKAFGQKAFRAKQIFRWLYGQPSVQSFEEMSNVPKDLREQLLQHFFISHIEPTNEKTSAELEAMQTLKFLFRLSDGKEIETVLIPRKGDKLTVCVSSQVGCALGCKFCATGYMGFTRNLSIGEIMDQALLVNAWTLKNLGRKITNVVFMGMGEPFLNYDTVMLAVRMMADKDYALNLPIQHITVSTSGIADKIRKLGDEGLKCRLAVSLHAANDDVRNSFMPINESVSVAELRSAIKYYYDKVGMAITYEYVLLSGINDSEPNALDLIKFSRTAPCKINIIDYNPIAGAAFEITPLDQKNKFVQKLLAAGLTVTIRRSRGKDINAACGQLATASLSHKNIKSHKPSRLEV
jgi:23S rRNA (adenine2503-C2)-methyltransferase